MIAISVICFMANATIKHMPYGLTTYTVRKMPFNWHRVDQKNHLPTYKYADLWGNLFGLEIEAPDFLTAKLSFQKLFSLCKTNKLFFFSREPLERNEKETGKKSHFKQLKINFNLWLNELVLLLKLLWIHFTENKHTPNVKWLTTL